MGGFNIKDKLWNFYFIYLLMLNALTAVSFQMVTPIITPFAVNMGVGMAAAGTLAGLFSITALIVRPLSGWVADSFNKKWLMVGATSLIAMSVLGYALAVSVQMLFAVRIVHGVAFAVSSTTNAAFASSFIPEKRMGEGIAFLGLGQILALAVGPVISVWAAEKINYASAFTISFGIAAIAAVLMCFIKPPASAIIKQPLKLSVSNLIAVKLIPLAVFGGLFSLTNGLISSFLVMLGNERGINNIGLFFTFNAITLLVTRPFGGRLNDRKGLTFVLIPSYIISAAAMGVIAGAHSIWMVAIAGILKALGQGIGQPAIQAECILKMPERRGLATGTFYIGADIGQGLGPIIGGAVLSAYDFGVLYMGAGVLMLLGMAGYFVYKKYSR